MDGGDDDDDDAAREHSVGKSTGSKGPRTRSRGRAEASEALAEADAKKKTDATSTSARSCVLIYVVRIRSYDDRRLAELADATVERHRARTAARNQM